MINAIIIDDEKAGRETLETLIAKYCPQVKILAAADSVKKGIALLSEHKPDLVFLDINMPHATGFELLSRLKEVNFEVVFTTAYAEHALNAIKHNALDYLLKPIDVKELEAAVKKCEEKIKNNQPGNLNIAALLTAMKQSTKSPRLSVSSQDGILYFAPEEIIRLEADSNYTQIYLKTGHKVTASRSIKEYEDFLLSHNFFRIHDSHIINLAYVKKYSKGIGGQIIMSDDTTLEVSKYRKNKLLEALSN